MVGKGVSFSFGDESFSSRALQARTRNQFQEKHEQLGREILQGLAGKLSAREAEELRALAREQDPLMFFESLVAFGQRLEEQRKTEAAVAVYQAISVPGTPPLAAAHAAQRLDALMGRGHSGLRAEVLLKNLSHAATDSRTIVPMLAGSMLYQGVRTVTMGRLALSPHATWLTRGWGVKAAGAVVGTAVEIPAFTVMSRGLMSLSGEAVSSSVWEDLGRNGITLGALKLSGWVGNKMAGARVGTPVWAKSLLPQTTTFLGLLTAHRLEAGLGLRREVDNATTVTDTLGAMVSLGIGAHLGNQILGSGFANFQRELAYRAEIRPHPTGMPNWNSAVGAGLVPVRVHPSGFLHGDSAPGRSLAKGPQLPAPMQMSSLGDSKTQKSPAISTGKSDSPPVQSHRILEEYFGVPIETEVIAAKPVHNLVLIATSMRNSFLDILVGGKEGHIPLKGRLAEMLRSTPELQRDLLGENSQVAVKMEATTGKILSIRVTIAEKIKIEFLDEVQDPNPSVTHVPGGEANTTPDGDQHLGDWVWRVLREAENEMSVQEVTDAIRAQGYPEVKLHSVRRLLWQLGKSGDLDVREVTDPQRPKFSKKLYRIKKNPGGSSGAGSSNPPPAAGENSPASPAPEDQGPSASREREAASANQPALPLPPEPSPSGEGASLLLFRKRYLIDNLLRVALLAPTKRGWNQLWSRGRKIYETLESSQLTMPGELKEIYRERLLDILEEALLGEEEGNSSQPALALHALQGIESVLKINYLPELGIPAVPSTPSETHVEGNAVVSGNRSAEESVTAPEPPQSLEDEGLTLIVESRKILEEESVPEPLQRWGSVLLDNLEGMFFKLEELGIPLETFLEWTRDSRFRIYSAYQQAREGREPSLGPVTDLIRQISDVWKTRLSISEEVAQANPRMAAPVEPAGLAPIERVLDPKPGDGILGLGETLRWISLPIGSTNGKRNFRGHLIFPDLSHLEIYLAADSNGNIDPQDPELEQARWIKYPYEKSQAIQIEKVQGFKGQVKVFFPEPLPPLTLELQTKQVNKKLDRWIYPAPRQPEYPGEIAPFFAKNSPPKRSVAILQFQLISDALKPGFHGDRFKKYHLHLSNGDRIEMELRVAHHSGGRVQVEEARLQRFGTANWADLNFSSGEAGKKQKMALKGHGYQIDINLVPPNGTKSNPIFTESYFRSFPPPVHLRIAELPAQGPKPIPELGAERFPNRIPAAEAGAIEAEVTGREEQAIHTLGFYALKGSAEAVQSLGDLAATQESAVQELLSIFELLQDSEFVEMTHPSRPANQIQEDAVKALREAAVGGSEKALAELFSLHEKDFSIALFEIQLVGLSASTHAERARQFLFQRIRLGEARALRGLVTLAQGYVPGTDEDAIRAFFAGLNLNSEGAGVSLAEQMKSNPDVLELTVELAKREHPGARQALQEWRDIRHYLEMLKAEPTDRILWFLLQDAAEYGPFARHALRQFIQSIEPVLVLKDPLAFLGMSLPPFPMGEVLRERLTQLAAEHPEVLTVFRSLSTEHLENQVKSGLATILKETESRASVVTPSQAEIRVEPIAEPVEPPRTESSTSGEQDRQNLQRMDRILRKYHGTNMRKLLRGDLFLEISYLPPHLTPEQRKNQSLIYCSALIRALNQKSVKQMLVYLDALRALDLFLENDAHEQLVEKLKPHRYRFSHYPALASFVDAILARGSKSRLLEEIQLQDSAANSETLKRLVDVVTAENNSQVEQDVLKAWNRLINFAPQEEMIPWSERISSLMVEVSQRMSVFKDGFEGMLSETRTRTLHFLSLLLNSLLKKMNSEAKVKFRSQWDQLQIEEEIKQAVAESLPN